MAASTFVPAPRSTSDSQARHVRALASVASARTAARGAGLAPVIAMPTRGASGRGRAAQDDAEHVAAPAPAPVALRIVTAPSALPDRGRAWVGVLATVAVAVALAVSGLVGATTSGAGELEVAGHVVLQPGETLWDVAVRSAPAGVDPRRQLDDIRRVNGFGPGAHDAWTVVLIPAR